MTAIAGPFRGPLLPQARLHAALPGFIVATSTILGAPPFVMSGTTTASIQTADSGSQVIESLNVRSSVRQRMSTGDRVDALRALSGLTVDQMGRLMGVSRRSIHNWMNGGSMSRANEERLSRLFEVVQGLPGGPDQRRAALLDSSSGVSLFHRILRENTEWAVVQEAGSSTRGRIGW